MAGALPAQSTLLAEVGIPGRAHKYAVVYRGTDVRLGVVAAVRQQLLWSRRLPPGSVSLITPGPAGLFQILVKAASGQSASFFAYELSHGSVSSAIGGDPSGEVKADEGVKQTGGAFLTRLRDLSHVGSVKYRLVTRYIWSGGLYRQTSRVRVPDYPAGQYPLPNGTVKTQHGDLILVRLEIAATEQARERGLMYRKSLDPDAGMVFVWQQPVTESFWMENTYIPLSIAFLGADGGVQEIQNMQPMTTVLHTPVQPYLYAIEANQGFFVANGIAVGDTVNLHLGSQG